MARGEGALGALAVADGAGECAVLVEQVDECGVIDVVAAVRVWLPLLPVDPPRPGEVPDLPWRVGDAGHAIGLGGQVVAENPGRVALGIHGDEEGLEIGAEALGLQRLHQPSIS